MVNKGSRFTQVEYSACKPYQRMNHFPNSGIITRKDTLLRMLRTMKGIYGTIYDFFPISFNLPTEYKKFVRHFHAEQEQSGKNGIWICKPTDMSRGRGITVFKELHELVYDTSSLVQKYISNPLLISNYKFDMRWYTFFNYIVIFW
jgi:tubulin polyglutamylase TTLL2